MSFVIRQDHYLTYGLLMGMCCYTEFECVELQQGFMNAFVSGAAHLLYWNATRFEGVEFRQAFVHDVQVELTAYGNVLIQEFE